jgi:hypothetical protein
MLAGKELVDIDSLVVERSMRHGHVEAILTMMRRLEIPGIRIILLISTQNEPASSRRADVEISSRCAA